MSAEIHQAVGERLRAVEQRYTPARRRIVELLSRSSDPMTLPELQRVDRSLAQSSTYRNLGVLEEVGAVTRILTGSDYASFELAEDLTGHHHHHLVCAGCGQVTDFSLGEKLESELERALTRAARRASYAVEHHRLDLVGRCGTCR